MEIWPLSDALIAATIAGAVSLVVSALGYLATRQKLRAERRALQRQLETQWAAKVYEERFRRYPEAFRITSMIQQVRAPHHLPPKPRIDELRHDLNLWAAEAGLFMSRNAARAYMDLRAALAKNPETGERYSREQGAKIWRLRNAFRRELRADIGNVYVEDAESDAAPYWEVL